jgi:hypothetical protein
VQDAPDAATLLGAIAEVLESRVLPETSSSRHQVRVAVNLCRILQREVLLEPHAVRRDRAALAAIVGHDGGAEALWSELADQLDAGQHVGADEADVHDVLLAVVRRKLAVSKPGYGDVEGDTR